MLCMPLMESWASEVAQILWSPEDCMCVLDGRHWATGVIYIAGHWFCFDFLITVLQFFPPRVRKYLTYFYFTKGHLGLWKTWDFVRDVEYFKETLNFVWLNFLKTVKPFKFIVVLYCVINLESWGDTMKETWFSIYIFVCQVKFLCQLRFCPPDIK